MFVFPVITRYEITCVEIQVVCENLYAFIKYGAQLICCFAFMAKLFVLDEICVIIYCRSISLKENVKYIKEADNFKSHNLVLVLPTHNFCQMLRTKPLLD